MTRYVALLRGVNVGGVTIKMADLADVVRGLGYDDVKTVLASGNVLLSTSDSAATITTNLQNALRERFGYQAWVQVLTANRVVKIVADYPFERGRDGWHDYAIFVVDPGVKDELLAVELDPETERTAAGDGVVYWTVPKGSTLDSRIGTATGAARFKPSITTRNLNTLEKLSS
jgi:uncharacterized protein (DUF1697 family)